MIPDGYISEGSDWYAGPPAVPPAAVTFKEASDSRGRVYLILDAAMEPIDSTTRPSRVEALVTYWQEVLYGRKT
jgi:hypothetical protein